MGRVNKLLSFERSSVDDTKVNDVKVNRGAGDNRTLQHFSDTGDDSVPLPGDYVQSSSQVGTGRDSAVGYIDPKNEQKSSAGDKRIYARDPDSGEQVAEVWLKNSGEILIQNDKAYVKISASGVCEMNNSAGYIKILESGVIEMNGARVTVEGDFVTPYGVSSSNHTHEQPNDGDGDAEATTNPPNSTEA